MNGLPDFRIIKVTGNDAAHVLRELEALPGHVVNGLYIETLGIHEPAHQEDGIWCLRVYVEGIIGGINES